MSKNIEGKSFLKITTASKEIDVNAKEYHSILEVLGILPIPPVDGGKIPGNFRITIDVHERVKEHLRNSAYTNSGAEIVNESKDFLDVMESYDLEIKSSKTVSIVKRRTQAFYSEEKLLQIRKIIDDVNKRIQDSRTIHENGYETIKFNEFMQSTYLYSRHEGFPKLKLRTNEKYGHQIYLEYTVEEEEIKNGKVIRVRKKKQLTGYLNRIDEKSLYWYALFTSLFIYDKIKLGYFIKLNFKKSKNWNMISSTPPNELYLIPTLLAYLEHFKETSFKSRYTSSLYGNINHLIRYLHPNISVNEVIKYEELNHSMKFVDFNYQKVTKFIEYLRKTNTGRTKKPASGITIKNINSNLGNLVGKILNQHEPSFKNYDNPFLKHGIHTEKREMHPYFSKVQLTSLLKTIRQEKDFQLLTIVHLIYHTGCRRIEAERLKVKHIELTDNKLRLYRLEEDGRTKTTERTATIHPDLKRILLTLELDKYDGEDFLFTKNKIPGKVRVGHNYFQNHFKKIKMKCPELTNKHGLYGLKHTFCINYLKTAKNPEDLEKKKEKLSTILGHQSFKETKIYIKGLDLSDLFPEDFEGFQRLEE